MVEVITDAKGRKLETRDLNVLDQVKLLRAIGSEQSTNQPYVQIVMLIAKVSTIDGVPVPFPTSERQIDSAIAMIGDHGFVALTLHAEKEMAEIYSAVSEETKAYDPLEQSA